MTIQVAYSQNPDPYTAADEIRSSFSGVEPVMVTFFASSQYEPEGISAAMKKAFPGATVNGCSTAGEIVSGQMLKHSVVAMAMDAGTIRSVQADTISLDKLQNADETIKRLSGVWGETPISLDPTRFVGMILFDGLSGSEESFMDRLGDLTNISVIGGSAGDDLAFSKTYVYLDGKAYTSSAVLAIIEPATGFDIIKTQSFCSLGKKLTPTKVDAATRKVLEFDGKPAAEAYAQALGVSVAEASNLFMKHPVGLMAGDEPFVRSPQQLDGNSVCFYCQVHEGVELDILSSTEIIEDTKKAVLEKNSQKSIAGLINFNCILRTLQLENEGKTEEYGRVFSDIPTIGFSTYGEEYIGHINQTATMLVFFKE